MKEVLSNNFYPNTENYGGPKGPTQTKKENAREKAQRKQKSTTQIKKHNANKKAQRKQKSITQTKKHNANKKAKRKQKSTTQTKKHNANKKNQLKLHQSHVNSVHFNGFVLRFFSFLALYRKR